MNRKPYETKREGNRETKRENYTVYKYIYIYCDVTNVDFFLKKPYINPKGTTPDQFSSVQLISVIQRYRVVNLISVF